MPLTRETQNKMTLPKRQSAVKVKKSHKEKTNIIKKSIYEKAAYPWKHKKELKRKFSSSSESEKGKAEEKPRRKRLSSSKSKEKRAKKKKHVHVSSSSSESDNIDPEFLKPISAFVNEPTTMLDHVFYSLTKDEIRSILPTELKKKSMDELRGLIEEELKGMSKARISAVLGGKDLEESSGDEEEEDDKSIDDIFNSDSSPDVSQPSSPTISMSSSSLDFSDSDVEEVKHVKKIKKEKKESSPPSTENIEALLPIYRSFSPYTGEHEIKHEPVDVTPEPEKKPETPRKTKKRKKKSKKHDLEDGEITTSSDSDQISDSSSESKKDQPVSSKALKKSDSEKSNCSSLPLQIRIQNVRKENPNSPESVIFYEDGEQDEGEVIRLESGGEGLIVEWKQESDDEGAPSSSNQGITTEIEDIKLPCAKKVAADSTTMAENELGDCPEIEFDEE